MKGGKINRLQVTFLEKFSLLCRKRKVYTAALYTIINMIRIVFGIINDSEDSENR